MRLKLFTQIITYCFIYLLLATTYFSQTGCVECRRADGTINQAADVIDLTLSTNKLFLPCSPETRPRAGECDDNRMLIDVVTTARDKESDLLKYSYTVSGGRIIGEGAKVSWDLSGVQPGYYTITVGVDDGCGFCGKTVTQVVRVMNCTCEQACESPTVDVSGSELVKQGETATVTANVSSAFEVTYNWTLSNGTIISGQGTPVITIDTAGLAGQNITATVEISSDRFCPGSQTVNSFTVSVSPSGNINVRPNIESICNEFTPLKYTNNRFEFDYLDSSQQILIYQLSSAVGAYQTRKYDVALAELNEILKQNENDREKLNPCILNLIGAIYSDTGNYQKAIGFYQQLLILAAKQEQIYWQASAESNIGLAYFELQQYSKAILFFEKNIKFFTQNEDDYGLATTLNYYGAALRGLRLYKQANDAHTKALKLAEKNNYRTLAADVLEELGRNALAQNQIAVAIQIFQQSLILFRQLGDSYGETESLLDLMDAQSKTNQPRYAIFYGSQAINLLQKVRQNIQSLSRIEQEKFLKTKEKYYRKLAEILIDAGRFFEAQQVLALLKQEEYADYAMRDADEIKKLSTLDGLRVVDRAALQKYEEIAAKLTEYGTRLVKLEETGQTQSAEYADLKTKLDDANTAFRLFLDKTLTAELGKPVVEEIKKDRALQGKLQSWGNGTVALYTIVGEKFYRVILTTPKNQIDKKYEISREELNKKIFEFRAVLQDVSVDPRPIGKELYDILIKPIEADLQAAEAKTLLWSLDGTLRYVPFAALSPDGKEYLAEKYKSVVVTSTIRQNISSSVEQKWQIFGAGVTKESSVVEPNGTTTIRFDKLPGVESELLNIISNENAAAQEKGILTGRRLFDEAFDIKAFEDAMKTRIGDKPKYNVIHLATHFRLGGTTANSFLLLGKNQALTLDKVSDNTNLNFDEVELVTLSACNTGFGTAVGNVSANREQEKLVLEQNKGAEVDSLATFIELRGAKSVLATLWAVADESTSIWMSEFYRQKKDKPEMTKSDALQTAQLKLIQGKYTTSEAKENRGTAVFSIGGNRKLPAFKKDENAPFAHPFYWSPFVLIGNWR